MGIEFVKTAAMIVIFGLAWNLARTKLAESGNDRVVGAMSFIYN